MDIMVNTSKIIFNHKSHGKFANDSKNKAKNDEKLNLEMCIKQIRYDFGWTIHELCFIKLCEVNCGRARLPNEIKWIVLCIYLIRGGMVALSWNI